MATDPTLSRLFSPKNLDKRADDPTPIPTPKAIKMFCTGKARETAVRASSDTLDTNIESTML